MVDVLFDLAAGHGLVVKSCIQAAQDFSEQRIIVNGTTDIVDHIGPFIIHIPAAFVIDAILTLYRPVVLNIFPDTIDILLACCLAPVVFREEGFAVIGKTLMDPHISNVLRGDIIAKPFMPAFMDDDKVEF